jgi:histidinol phosphatase-like enzyme
MLRFIQFVEQKDACPILTAAHMKAFEQFVDKLFAKFGIDFEFTRHFRDRMSHERNDPCIDMKELASMIQKIYKKYQGGEKSLNKFVDAEAVIKDLQTNLNMPIAVEYDRKNDELVVIAKTIMRKKNFRTPNPEIKV